MALFSPVPDFLKRAPPLQGQYDGGDGEGDQHDDHEHGGRLGAGALHALVQKLLHVVDVGAGQVADDDVIAEQQAHRQQAGHRNAGQDIGHDDLEKGLQDYNEYCRLVDKFMREN